MKNKEHENFESVCSVVKLAEKLDLSRARFYQLQKSGIFPPPVYSIYTKRPFFPANLQNQCLKIRNSGVGLNGNPVIFYSKREKQASKTQSCSKQNFKDLSDMLKAMGLKVLPAKAGKAFMTFTPKIGTALISMERLQPKFINTLVIMCKKGV